MEDLNAGSEAMTTLPAYGKLFSGLLLLSIATSTPSNSFAANNPDVQGGGGAFGIHATKESPGTSTTSHTSTPQAPSNPNAPIYEWRTGCAGSKSVQGGSDTVCGAPCPPGEIYMERWQVHPPPARRTPASACMSPADAAAAAVPQVTPAMVATAFQRLPMPAFKSQVQPAAKTLVNFDTIFFTSARPFNRDVTILGQNVNLRITPSRFTWHYGDGTSASTTSPGAKYPRKDVVHRYQQAHVTVNHHLTINWSARWRLNGGAWQDVNGTATSTGPNTALRIAEAVPVLSGQGH